MARHPITDPEAARFVGATTDALRILPEPAPESDFSDLAARFSAAGGGGLSEALSADLALQIVLNEIVEQACLATGATGAALAVLRDGEMVCTATSGSTTPELGARLSAINGLSGLCVQTRAAQLCGDVLADRRPEVQALQRLGARSVAAMPLLHGNEVVGIFEVLSSRPAAFGERDERTLEALSRRAVINLERAAHAPQPPAPAVLPVDSPGLERLRNQEREKPEREKPVKPTALPPLASQPERSRPAPARPEGSKIVTRGFDIATWVMGAAVLFSAVMLGVLITRHVGVRRVGLHSPRPAAVSAQAAPSAPVVDTAADRSSNSTPGMTDSSDSPSARNVSSGGASEKTARGDASRPARSSQTEASVPPGGLLIYQDGKEVFRMLPNQNPVTTAAANRAVGVKPAASLEPERIETVEVPAAEAETNLVHRVEPDYPDAALQQHIQGRVLLDLRIATDGSIEGLRVTSGPAQLAQAATDAVKQWRFQPRTVNGRAVGVHTTVTLSFRLPQ